MSKQSPKHIEVHINELVLPRGSRMPDQAALRRMVEAEIQRRLSMSPHNTAESDGSPSSPLDCIADMTAAHVQSHLKGKA